MKKMNKILGFFLLSLIFAGCTQITLSQKKREIYSVEEILQLDLVYEAKKACYSPFHSILYVMDNQNQLHSYDGNEKIMTFGGLGFSNQKFTFLSDIAISTDGNILALDSYKKKISKIDKNGKIIAEILLNDIGQPTLFDVNSEDKVIIYDSSRNEFVLYNLVSSSKEYTFGRFTTTNPTSIVCQKDLIIINDTEETFFFSYFGDLIQTEPASIQSDRWNNFFRLSSNSISYNDKKDFLNINGWKWMSVKSGHLLAIDKKNALTLSKIIYNKEISPNSTQSSGGAKK
ncbi:MAG: hypothetical protein PHR06_10695 [Candidatus Cloacimonetes bacterium]|nr:hypothetical protein [Candidatus Cloacimonadota bacterium]